MTKLIEELSVFFPAYNEEVNLENTVQKARNVLQNIAERWEIIIVNDGSKDNTLKIAGKLASRDAHIKVVNHNVNKGYGAAFKSGLFTAKYPWIAFTDSDGQFDFSEIEGFIKKQKSSNSDIVIGYYLDRKVGIFIKITSKIWEWIVYLMFGLKVKDIDCGFKLISKKVADSIPDLKSERGAFISSELLIKAKKKGFKITEIGVHHYPRSGGKATGRNLNVIIKSFIDLVRLWRKLRQ